MHHAPLKLTCAGALALTALSIAAPADAQTTYKVALRAATTGELLATHPNGRVAFTGTADSTRVWYLIDLNGGDLVDGDKIALRSGVNRKYLVAEGAGGGDVNVNRTERKGWETFTLRKVWGEGDSILHTMPVTLRTHNGHYLSVTSSSGTTRLSARTRNVGREGRFRVLFIERSVREARASYAEGYARPPGSPSRPPRTGPPTGPPVNVGSGASGTTTLQPGTIGR